MTLPELRFPGFKSEWQKDKLNGVIKSIDAGWSPQCEEYPATLQEWGVLKTTAIVWEGFNENENKKLPFKLAPKKEMEVQANDILITRAGPRNRVGVTVHVDNVRPKLMLSDKIIRIRVSDDHSSKFFAILLANNNAQQQLFSKSSGLATSQTNISQEILLGTALIFPKLPEQKRIASFFTAIDKRVKLLRQKKILMEEYKKGVMNQLLSQERRFKNETGKAFPKWERQTLEAIVKIKKGEQLNKEELTGSGKYPCINGGVLPSGYTDKFNSFKDTITISEGGNSCGYVNFLTTNFWSGGHCYTLSVLDETKTDNTFIFQCLKNKEKEIMRLRVGSGLPNIQKKALQEFTIDIPSSIKEQRQIGAFLSAIDEKLTFVQIQIEQTEQYKNGLLQQMFC